MSTKDKFKGIQWKHDPHGQQYLLDLNPLMCGCVFEVRSNSGLSFWSVKIIASGVIDIKEEFSDYKKAREHCMAVMENLIITANDVIFGFDPSKNN